MKIGHHFGKRKPRWNFFTDQYQSLVDSSSLIIVKLLLVSLGLQVLFFLPVLYWVFQNYAIIQTHIPAHFNMSENIEFEKKWIVFLILSSTVVATFWNAFLWLYVYKKTQFQSALNRDHALSHGEAVDQRLVS
ncbi:MAG: hypothetical protein A2622_03085 [Bdellovibrionales bacterium RIFCSPHIGHO2_01_FULL_40_29]|nr:MAG: hypothetical protein A2622_03085 [Bdellovibrionales bacterium RIFCSPHIGHO2_01_FULL_40_29]OFZ34058.1 MAG: hypothetical protein A3D17_03505 [Bdellovibrionales bacterium RIFCSPHIGHO2_02_FULL_40_15]